MSESATSTFQETLDAKHEELREVNHLIEALDRKYKYGKGWKFNFGTILAALVLASCMSVAGLVIQHVVTMLVGGILCVALIILSVVIAKMWLHQQMIEFMPDTHLDAYNRYTRRRKVLENQLRELRERHDAEQRALEAQHVSMHAGKLSVTTEEQSGDLALVEHESSELP